MPYGIQGTYMGLTQDLWKIQTLLQHSLETGRMCKDISGGTGSSGCWISSLVNAVKEGWGVWCSSHWVSSVGCLIRFHSLIRAPWAAKRHLKLNWWIHLFTILDIVSNPRHLWRFGWCDLGCAGDLCYPRTAAWRPDRIFQGTSKGIQQHQMSKPTKNS